MNGKDADAAIGDAGQGLHRDQWVQFELSQMLVHEDVLASAQHAHLPRVGASGRQGRIEHVLILRDPGGCGLIPDVLPHADLLDEGVQSL